MIRRALCAKCRWLSVWTVAPRQHAYILVDWFVRNSGRSHIRLGDSSEIAAKLALAYRFNQVLGPVERRPEYIPDAGFFPRSCEHAIAVGAEDGVPNKLAVPHHFAHGLAGLGVPDAGGLVLRRRDHALAVRVEAGGDHCAACLITSPAGLPVSASHTRAASSVSPDAVTTRLPSGLKLADTTCAACVIASPTGLPVRVPHASGLVLDAVTTRLPSRLKLAEETLRRASSPRPWACRCPRPKRAPSGP